MQKVRFEKGQEHVAQQNRRRLLERVRTMWIEGVLEHSLHQAALMALDVQEQPDALADPWHLESQETNQPPYPLPHGTFIVQVYDEAGGELLAEWYLDAPGGNIVQVYDEAGGELLILGEPGAGKTTLLLELARTLLERAEADENARLPVVFHLSSWAEQCPPLSDWLVEELRTTYQVPRELGKAWIAKQGILPLLDGLDEVAEEARPGCVQAINAYRERQSEKGAAPLVVCCRSQDYAELPTRVNLRQAVSIQPLTEEQIEGHVQGTKGRLEGLRQALHNDPVLSELAQRPLMLNLMTLAYQGVGPVELPTAGTREAHQRQVSASYVERMLNHQGISNHASGEHMLRWLRFLATQMQQHYKTVFFLEQLQPDWLTDQRRRLLHQLSYWLVVALVGGLVGVQAGGLAGELVGWVAGGLFGGLLCGLFVILAFHQLDERSRLRPSPGIRRLLAVGLVGGLLVGLLVGLYYGLLVGLLACLTTAAHVLEERGAREVGLSCFKVTSYTIGNMQRCALSDLW